MKGGLEKVKASGIRMCGGKVGELLTRNGIETLGDIQAVTH